MIRYCGAFCLLVDYERGVVSMFRPVTRPYTALTTFLVSLCFALVGAASNAGADESRAGVS